MVRGKKSDAVLCMQVQGELATCSRMCGFNVCESWHTYAERLNPHMSFRSRSHHWGCCKLLTETIYRCQFNWLHHRSYFIVQKIDKAHTSSSLRGLRQGPSNSGLLRRPTPSADQSANGIHPHWEQDWLPAAKNRLSTAPGHLRGSRMSTAAEIVNFLYLARFVHLDRGQRSRRPVAKFPQV